MHRVANYIADRVRTAIPQAAEWQHVGDYINAAFIKLVVSMNSFVMASIANNNPQFFGLAQRPITH